MTEITSRQDAVVRPPRTRHRGLVLTAACLGFAVIQLDVSVVNVAVKPIGVSLGGGVTGLQWVVDAYTVAFAALILTAGSLGDRIGARRMCLAGFTLFTVASVACGLAPALTVLIAARALEGVGAAMLGACTLILLNHAYPEPEERARAVGLWALGASGALAAGPLAGGLLITVAGWRSIFFINLPLGILGFLLTGRYTTQTPRAGGTRHGVDIPGQALAIVTVAAAATAAIEAGTRGWLSPVVLAGFAIAAAAGTGFVLTERHRPRPMLPLGLFRQVPFGVSVAAGFTVSLAFYGLIFIVSLLLQRRLGFSPMSAGLAFVPVMTAIMAGNLTAGRLATRLGTRGGMTLGAAAMAAGCAVMLGTALTGLTASATVPLVAGLSLTGLGVGVIVPAITTAALGSVAVHRSGIAAGTLTAFRQSGSVLGVAVFGTLTGAAGPVTGLRAVAGISVALSLVILALARCARRGPRPPSSRTWRCG